MMSIVDCSALRTCAERTTYLMGGNLCSATAVSQVQLSGRLAFGIIVLSLLRGCLLHIRFVRWGSIHAFDGHGGCQPRL